MLNDKYKMMTDQFSGQVLADKYRVDSILREDSLGNLYRGTHLAMEKPVTIKILSPTTAVDEITVKRFSTEAKTLSRISHPNILNVTDYGSDKSGKEFIVLENADGETLQDTIRREGKFSLERTNRIVRQIAAALSVAHNNGVIHQNLTSENVILTKTVNDADSVKVLNFGTADPDASSGGGLDKEISAENAQYVSPEQCYANGEIDTRSDIYSLGVILYEMLAGEVPFVAEKPSDVMLKHAQEPPLPLSAFRTDLPNEISEVISTTLAKNPDARYQTANDFAAALNRTTLLSTNAKPTAAPFNLSEPPPATVILPDENPQNNIWKTAFIVLAGISVLAALFIYLTNVKQTNPTTQLATDANGQPVQPVNPATGTSEQSLSNMGAYNPEMMGNSNLANGMPQVLPGGDGYDPWARGGVPPKGAPPQGGFMPVQPGGAMTSVDPCNANSPFIPQDCVKIVNVPVNTNQSVNAQKPAVANTAKGKNTPAANTNAQTVPPTAAKPSPTPAASTASNTANPAAETKPAAASKNTKPTPQPKGNSTPKPAPNDK